MSHVTKYDAYAECKFDCSTFSTIKSTASLSLGVSTCTLWQRILTSAPRLSPVPPPTLL